jgi:hypothetical protein
MAMLMKETRTGVWINRFRCTGRIQNVVNTRQWVAKMYGGLQAKGIDHS